MSIHAHTGLTIHLSSNPGVRTGSYQNCIARHTVQSALWHEIIRQIRRRGLTGVCKCVYGTVTGLEKETICCICELALRLTRSNQADTISLLSGSSGWLSGWMCIQYEPT
jgi:hypothetical protein